MLPDLKKLDALSDAEFEALYDSIHAEDLSRPHRATYGPMLIALKKLSDFDLDFAIKKVDQESDRRSLDELYDVEESSESDSREIIMATRKLAIRANEGAATKDLRKLVSRISLALDREEA